MLTRQSPRLQICAPVSVLIRALDPGATSSYAVQADQSVVDALEFRIDNNVLNIESKQVGVGSGGCQPGS